MTETTQPPAGATPPPPAPPPSMWQRVGRWAAIAAGIVIGLVGIIRLVVNYTVLPSCDSSRMTDTLRSIYGKQKVAFKGISDIKTVSSTSSEVTCTALVDIGGDQESINYRSYWEGWTAQVAVRAGLPRCDAPRTGETLHNIFKGRKVTVNRISDFQTVTTSEAENVCTAQVDAPGELATITFLIFRKEGSTQVLITDVKSQPK